MIGTDLILNLLWKKCLSHIYLKFLSFVIEGLQNTVSICDKEVSLIKSKQYRFLIYSVQTSCKLIKFVQFWLSAYKYICSAHIFNISIHLFFFKIVINIFHITCNTQMDSHEKKVLDCVDKVQREVRLELIIHTNSLTRHWNGQNKFYCKTYLRPPYP